MKGCKRISLIVPVVMTLVAGCGHKETNGHAHSDEKTDVGVTFNAKHGLHVPPETAKFIGLQVVDVEERKVPSTLQFSAHIYRAASEAPFASSQVSAAATALASASLSSAEAALLRVEQPVSVTTQGAASFPGRILGVNRDLEKASAHVEILLAISDERARLARGAFVSVSVHLGGERNVVSVPRSALLRTAEGDFVYTVSGEHFVRTPIKVGMVNHEFVEVTDGLYAGDGVAVTPVMTLWLAELQSIRGGKACADGH
jgi:multidrug efflux pump subunit AcrA (membrane-fusion protein)